MTTESWAYVLVRWGSYLALATALGCVAARLYVRIGPTLGTERSDEEALARIGVLSCGALIVLAALRAWMQWLTLGGADAGSFPELMRPMLFETIWGLALVAQAVLAIPGLMAFAAVPRRGAWGAAFAVVVLLSITPGLSGHAVGSKRPVLAVVLDTLHVIAGGAWLGTLVVLVISFVPKISDPLARGQLQQLLVRFSRLALSSAVLLTATGVYAAWVHVGSWRALWSTPYGDALVKKLLLVLGILVLGAVNWRVVVPWLVSPRGANRFRMSGVAEVALALLTYLVTAILVGRPLPADMAQPPAG